jgi:hypothetical protein
MKNTEEKEHISPLCERFETAVFYLKVVNQLAAQLEALRQEGHWTLRQRWSLWKTAVAYKFTRWRLNWWFERIGDPECIYIPSRHGLVFHAIEKPDAQSALDCLEKTGEFSCCLIPKVSKAQRQGLYKRARKRGFEVRTEIRHSSLLIERLAS